VAVIADLLGGLDDLSPFFVCRGIQWLRLAGSIFGPDRVEAATTTVWTVAASWGYAPSARRDVRMTLAIALLANQSPSLADLTLEGLAALRNHAYTKVMAENLDVVSRVLASLGLLAAPLPRRHAPPVPFGERAAPEGVDPLWLDWVRRWHRAAVGLTVRVRDHYALALVRVGRWLAQVHPEITSPEQWTYELAADCGEMIQALTIGQYCARTDQRQYMGRYGQPLKPVPKTAIYVALRTFFTDLQTEPFNLRRRFDPGRAFRVPAALRRAIGPNPRAIDIRWWAMIVHAAVHLDETDLPRGPSGPPYPLALVRAVALVWCYAALRSDEIRRLTVGCVRWQREDVTVAETGDLLPKDAVCFLSIPVNKTDTAFPKAVNPLVGHAIAAWERERPADQPALPDRKTGQLTHHLFLYRGHLIGESFINQTVIPLLCRRAGLPTMDDRGNITSHRARSTIATALYNAPDGMTIWELMQWLGHKHPSSTQQYARANPTKVAIAYEKAERNSRLVEVLIDHQADPGGAVKVYYVLGEHGLCSNAEWYSCIYRMACIKCPFFIPQDQAAVIRSRETVETFLKTVELTPEEVAAVEEDRDKLTETHERTRALPRPNALHQRAKGRSERGIPLRVVQGGDTRSAPGPEGGERRPTDMPDRTV
jgi:integrase